MQYESDDVKARALQCARVREYGLVIELGVLKNA